MKRKIFHMSISVINITFESPCISNVLGKENTIVLGLITNKFNSRCSSDNYPIIDWDRAREIERNVAIW